MNSTTTIRYEGNSVFIKSYPAIGVLALTSFVDNASGESGSIIFQKYFRYSTDGINYGEWTPLTLGAITGLTVDPDKLLIFEIEYQKNQPEGSDVLQVSEFEIGTTLEPTPELQYFDNSVFKEFFDSTDPEVLQWYVSVLEKLYARGLVPSYIDRLNDFLKPDDYLEFWGSVAKFFAYLVIYARKFQKFYESEVLTEEFLEERGMNVSVENNLAEMNYLMTNFYKEIFNRGTIHIVDKVENGDVIDGELLRLIFYKREEDEVLFNPYQKEHFGWNLGNSSPLYKGLHLNDSINKSYESHLDILDLSKYPLIGAVSIQVDGDKSTMRIVSGGGIDKTGDVTKKIKVDNRLDYELSFLIKKEEGEDLTVGITAYDKDENVTQMRSYKTGVSGENTFFANAPLSRDDKYVLVRCFMYNKNRTPYANDTTEIHQGQDLIFGEDVVYIIPTIYCGGTANIWGIRILPMQTNYSRGFLQVNNFISAWLKNRNNALTINDVKDYIRKYLIPYNSYIELTDVGEAGYNEVETPPDQFYWQPEGAYCERVGWRPIDPSCEQINLAWVAEEETAYCQTEEGIPGPTGPIE